MVDVVVAAGDAVATTVATAAAAAAGVVVVVDVVVCFCVRLRDVDDTCGAGEGFSGGNVSLDGVDARESDWFDSGFFGFDTVAGIKVNIT